MQYPRYLEGPLRSPASQGKARLVLGARQTGKSTLFARLRQQGDLVLDLQERSERLRLGRDPEALTRALTPPKRGRQRVFIDEVQRVPELLDEIQLVLDRYPGKFTFTLTGSSARRLRRGSTNLLPGRTHRLTLSPVCLWEVEPEGSAQVLLPPRRAAVRRRSAVPPGFPRRSLESMLLFGNLPAAYSEGRSFPATLESYAEAYIEEEVLREMAARNLGVYGRFLELAAVESGKAINLTKLSQESAIALSTLRGFYSVLEDTLLGFSLQPFSRSPRSRLLTTPRFYFFDVGVRNVLARLPLEKGILATQGGQLFEHWVACELAARIAYLGRQWRLSFWRTVDGAEVDFIVETPREVIPIEVKYTQNPRPADASGLERFIVRHATLCRRGFVICRTEREQQLSAHVRAISWRNL
jgi:predicted AAA+ superfamily ATPase